MIRVDTYQNRDIAIMGLARSGVSAARALIAGGARVHAWDDNEDRRDAARAEGISIVDLRATADTTRLWDDLAGIVWSPGIPHSYPKPHPVAVLAHERGVPVFSDISLLMQVCPDNLFIGITGTNGKSTTTALTGHILAHAGCSVQVGGNFGTPVLDFEPLPSDGIFVLELSSYQLELTPNLNCDAAAMLNITPDHLARHGCMDGYIEAKRLILNGRKAGRTVLVGIDDVASQGLFEDAASRDDLTDLPISGRRLPPGGIGVQGHKLVDATSEPSRIVFDLGQAVALPGWHNAQNIAAAYGLCRACGLAPDAIVAGIRSFPGLAHRQQLVAIIDGIRFVNDSKATNADATEKALDCYSNIYWILGGQPKEGGIASLAPHFSRIRKAFLIGESANAFAETLASHVPLQICETLDRAVPAAAAAAQADGLNDAVVLLSPAAASWDQFRDFEHRGEAFCDLVRDLTPEDPSHTPGKNTRLFGGDK